MNKLVYCAQPGRLSNRKREVMNFVLEQGYAPLHPFQAFPYDLFEGGKIGREKTMELCQRLIEAADEFWLFGVSEGTLQDLTYALKIKKHVRVFLDFDPEWEVYYKKLKEKYKSLHEFFQRLDTNI
jgi:hypothetical protein